MFQWLNKVGSLGGMWAHGGKQENATFLNNKKKRGSYYGTAQ